MKTAFLLWLGLAAGNFIYQATMGKKNWGEASKLSFFQALAILLAWVNRASL